MSQIFWISGMSAKRVRLQARALLRKAEKWGRE